MNTDGQALVRDVAPKDVEGIVERVEVREVRRLEGHALKLDDLHQGARAQRDDGLRHMPRIGNVEVGLELASPNLCGARQG